LKKKSVCLEEKRDELLAAIGKSEDLKKENLKQLEELLPKEEKLKFQLEGVSNRAAEFDVKRKINDFFYIINSELHCSREREDSYTSI